MKFINAAILLVFVTTLSLAQGEAGGTISYITTQNVYVKFQSTTGIQAGDTLFVQQGDVLVPALEVNNISSISCVCSQLPGVQLEVGDPVIATRNLPVIEEPPVEEPEPDTLSVAVQEPAKDTVSIEEKPVREEVINGRVAVSSYSNFSNTDVPMRQRMRYRFSFRGDHLNGSRVSVESYITFVHSNTRWDEIRDNIFNGLKIYNLAVKYDFSESSHFWLGRRINPRLSNMGAVDGLQWEKKLNDFTVGAIAGSRPDYSNYGFDFNLFQYGAFGSHELKTEKGSMQNTLAVAEQRNSGNIDRRFAYFQHTNSLLKDLYFFGSVELELYKVINEQKKNTLDLTNTYLSLRYRALRSLSLSVSYSARNNIIYYESDKEFLDRLLESEMLQGWRLQVNYRPVKYLSLGANAGYRKRKRDPKDSRNLYAYVSYSRVPGINASVTLSTTILQTAYINGNIYSLGLNRDLIPGKLFGGITYKMVDYKFENTEITLDQKVADVNLTFKLSKKFSLSVYYEGTFENPETYNRIYSNLSYRF